MYHNWGAGRPTADTMTGGTMPTLWDIALGLGRIARYGGQGKLWYPVLAHSFVVGELMASRGLPRLPGYMHDAHEVITGDVVYGWKGVGLGVHQDFLQHRIAHGLGFVWIPDVEDYCGGDIKACDLDAAYAELRLIGHGAGPLTPEPSEMARILTENQLEAIDNDPLSFLTPQGAHVLGFVDAVQQAITEFKEATHA